MIKRSNSLPFAKQTKQLGGVPYQTNINKKKLISDHLFQETTTENSEEENDRPKRKDENEVNSLQPYKMTQQNPTGLPQRAGNVTSYQNNDLQTYRNIRQLTKRLFTNKL